MEEDSLGAKKKAMSLLEHSDKSEWQLRQKLSERNFSEEAIEEAIAYVKSYHYLDDRRYALHYAEVYHTRRSRRRIRQDLLQRRISEEYIEEALEKTGGDEEALEQEIRKLTGGRTEFSYEEKQKMAAKLYRKGYQTGDIYKKLDIK